MTTIREVAQKAGVSYATVSHVINNTRFVTPETRERVVNAMDTLNYRPNALAQSLRKGTTNTIGLILPDSANPYFAEISRSIEAEAFKLGNSVILCNTERDLKREQFYVDVLSKKQVDGIIFVSTGHQVDSLNLLLSQGIPVVLVDRSVSQVEMDAVLTDNQEGGYIATRHLIELGHRRIACIAGPSHISPSAERIIGYRKALEEIGVPYDEAIVQQGDYHPNSGLQVTNHLLGLNPRPTAIFALNDLMALGAMRAAAEAGYNVPQDLAIIGFDDIEFACYTNPPLSTIAQPKQEIGIQAVNLLASRISDKSLPVRRIVLKPQLIVRGSTHFF
ncbi:MAG: LacI family transcriptional regulator [Chloroflexi bacterium]|nr:MAG: LacI family transcriptional regulator [Chloroflexota bacterium]RPI86230.1 MAG: LacI family transcriptional regulator [Chloroflexota bacterium]